MTTGAVIFAYNNEAFDYVRMAAWSASNIRRHLGIPVALITDQPTDLDFDKIIIHSSQTKDERWFSDADRRAIWHNHNRPDAFDLTPWDRTLLIDADYVVASNQLRSIIDRHGQLLCHRRAYDITGSNDFRNLNRLGRYDWSLCWATVMVFDRDLHARAVFDCMRMIRDNWTHYRHIYHESSKTYRNDHALTIALNVTNGHWADWPEIPWPLATMLPDHRLTRLDKDCYRIHFLRSNNRWAWIEVANQDFHAMAKQSLMAMIQ